MIHIIYLYFFQLPEFTLNRGGSAIIFFYLLLLSFIVIQVINDHLIILYTEKHSQPTHF